MKYVVENASGETITIDGLAVLGPEETREFTPDEVAGFTSIRGVPLLQTNVPAGVLVTVNTGEV